MKINRIIETNDKKFTWKDSIFLNIYGFFELYRYIALFIIGIAISVFVFLLVIDFIAPKEISNIDRKATLELFNQLQDANRHQDAILLMEYKGNEYLKDSPLELEYKQKLSDSYIHVGDYSKAEKMLLDTWEHAPKYMEEFTDEIKGKKGFEEFLKFGLARVIYQFYEKIGDTNNQLKYFDIYKKYYNLCSSQIDSISAEAYNKKTWFAHKTELNHKELIEYDEIVIASLNDKSKAIKRMEAYVDKIKDKKEYGPAFKVKCFCKLVEWQLANGLFPKAYTRIKEAITYVSQMQFVDEYQYLGKLSDYCYQIHDVELSKALYKRYQKFLDERYDKTDFEYLSNYARSFRYLEAEKDWKTLTENLIQYCDGMKHQILRNIPSMTEEQREFFAKQFDVPYEYSLHLLQESPSQELANLCFDNITFKNGLLLRSNRSIENSIQMLGDKDVEEKYKELKECRLNLIYQSVSGNIFTDEKKLQAQINDLEKEIAMKCTDFKIKNQTPDNSYQAVQDKLKENEAIVDLIEHESRLFALVLLHNKAVHYTPIGKLEDILDKLKQPTERLYHDAQLTDYIWGPISKIVDNKSVVYYLPIGMFNQLALGTLCTNETSNQYLCETKSIRLLSNPMDLMDESMMNLKAEAKGISLWGGIEYGMNDSQKPDLSTGKRSAVKRGDYLTNLKYAYLEVNEIAAMLEKKKIMNRLYTKDAATESAFKKRSGKGDYIIHISTHGFFNEKTNLNKSMYESGLFFAGANKYWSNDSIKLEIGQEDGILRAAEIAELNLAGCELVVLSACETGLGFSDTSEGVYGLQRAFKLAGAKHVLMSLWDVDDRATTLLMTEFYRSLLEGNDMEKSLERSRLKVKGEHPSPEDWGAFVLLY